MKLLWAPIVDSCFLRDIYYAGHSPRSYQGGGNKKPREEWGKRKKKDEKRGGNSEEKKGIEVKKREDIPILFSCLINTINNKGGERFFRVAIIYTPVLPQILRKKKILAGPCPISNRSGKTHKNISVFFSGRNL